ncbi:MAG TPA: C1 family peptidase, partial [Chitinophagales bacterium]|nr:C1 family peptidase [Chitinophagales bacterium]
IQLCMKQLLCLLFALVVLQATAQPPINTNKKGGGYTFTIQKMLEAAPVQNQFKSGTCWVFSTNSFIESELLRMGKGNINVSEMYVVRNMYIQKAEHYLRYQGNTNFGSGGEPHDVMNTIREYGLAPFSAYPGMPDGQVKPVMGEVDAVLRAMLDAMLKMHDGKLNPNWKAAFTGALDGYMGVPPQSFSYQGKTYTPKSFAESLGLNPDDYIEITSFTHHPFDKPFILEIPDNWANGEVYNVPLGDLKRIVDNAVMNNFSVAWATDISEHGFSFKNGVAIVPQTDYEDMTPAQRDSMFSRPEPEKGITQQLRQQAFDNLSTTDDHGMQIIGLATDQNGTPYYLVKNSWGTDKNDLEGYLYCSIPYFEYKTTCIMVNKHALPKDIAARLGIKL